ncbi:MAG TPA: T9SS type B sorting domain-containing protein [Lutibacter sp.]
MSTTLKNKFLILLLTLSITSLCAQREAGIWYFGNEAGVNFNSGVPVALTDGKLITNEGCASISDKDGNLLFYTDGSTVWNKIHQIMPNGSGLLGHSSSTQSAIIIPNPSNPFSYYIFTVDQPDDKNADDDPYNNKDDEKNDGLNYTEVNMNLNGGLGGINPSKKNIHLITYNKNDSKEAAFKCSEKITAVQHDDGISYWVITHFINNFYAFKITKSGVQAKPVISNTSTTIPITGYLNNAIGYLKSSPNGKKIAIAHASAKSTQNSGPKGHPVRDTGKVLLYNFDNSSGKVSNQISLLNSENPYGLDFSSKSKKLYVTVNNANADGIIEGSSLYQFDLESNNIPTSKILIKKNDFNAGALQLAIDEKIYRSGYNSAEVGYGHLSVINNPEADGLNCDFKENAIFLNGKKAKLGLPPFIQSLFLFTFKYEFTCFGDSTHFFISTVETIDSVLWDFGDGTSSTAIDAYHTYAAPGTYSVSLTKTTNGETRDPIVKEVVINEKPLILNTTYQLIQCDSYDSNPNDQLSTFNLENSIAALTLNKADDFNVYFYLNDADAKNDTYNENPLPLIFKNTGPNQLLTAKVMYKESDCFSLGHVQLIANSSRLLNAANFIGCDIGDGTASFNFTTKKNEIKSALNLPNTVIFYFYDLEENAINNVSPLGDDYISSDKIIYFRVENNGICYGAGTFNLVINYFPPVDPNETISICEGNFPKEINAFIPLAIRHNYSYNWSNGEDTHQILVLNEQQITLTITDKILKCEKVKTFNIVKVTSPHIIDVDVNINDNTAAVITDNNFDNLYAIDNPYNNYQSENTFYNVSPGLHTVYVKNKYDCDISVKDIYVLGFPKFFTPNNDGINDVWEIKGLNFAEFKYSNIFIFNRFGKHLATINPDAGWDGVYNGEFLPSNDYWFSIDVTDNENLTKTYKAHFSLVRK